MNNLSDFYDANKVPPEDRIPLDKNILLVVPDKKHDVGVVLKELGVSSFEVALTWPKKSVDLMAEIEAAQPQVVLQVDCQILPSDYLTVPGNGEYSDWAVLREWVASVLPDTFVGLHHHDEFSIKDGLGTVAQLVKLLKVQRRSFCCITNHGSVGGWIKQYNACKRAGIKALFGIEAYVSNYRGDDMEQRKAHRSANHLVLIANSEEGFFNIIRIHNDAQLNGFYYTPRVNREALEKWGKGIVGLSACMAGELPRFLMEGKEAEARETWEFYHRVFDAFYVEIQIIEAEDQREANRRLIQFARSVGAPLVMTCDCLASGTRVIMRDGTFKKVEDVVVGDEVATDDGKFSVVEATGSRKVRDGEGVFRITSGTQNQAIVATHNHPFLVDDGLESKWIEASKVKKGDWLVVPRPKRDIRHVSIRMSDFFESSRCVRLNDGRWTSTRTDKNCFVPEIIDVDKEFCWVLGMYIAEGYRDGYNVGFALHEDEREYFDRLDRFFIRYGYNPNDAIQTDHGRQIRVTSFGFAPMFESLCGRGAEQKHLPWFWRNLDDECLVALMDGIFCGDGSWSGRALSLSVVSGQLVSQIQQAALSLGLWGGIWKLQSRYDSRTGHWNQTQYGIAFGGPQVRKMSGWSKIGDIESKRDCWYHRVEEDRVLVRVDCNQRLQDGEVDLVHDIQVRGRHCFIAEGRVVHNSHYLDPEYCETHDVLMCMRQKKTIVDKREKDDVWSFDVRNLHYRDASAMRHVFENGFTDEQGEHAPFKDDVFTEEVFVEAMANTLRIARGTAAITLDSKIKLPKLYENGKEVLRKKVNAGFEFRKLMAKPNRDDYLKRIKYEFDAITRMGWGDYFLVMERIITDTRAKFGEWAIGYGRGCFHPASRVVMGDGTPRFIGNITAGDVVVSHDGSRQKVLKTFEYDVDEDLVEITTADGRALRCTPEHGIFIKTTDGMREIQAKDLKEGDDIVDVSYSPDRKERVSRSLIRTYAGNDTLRRKIGDASRRNWKRPEYQERVTGHGYHHGWFLSRCGRIYFASSWELMFLLWCEKNLDVLEFRRCVDAVEYEKPDGGMACYHPDFEIRRGHGREIVEVKGGRSDIDLVERKRQGAEKFYGNGATYSIFLQE